MNEKEENKLSRYFEKHSITQEDVNGIFTKKQTETDDLEDDEVEKTPTETNSNEKVEGKETEEKKTEEKVEDNKTEESGGSNEEHKETEEKVKEEQKQDDDQLSNLMKELGGLKDSVVSNAAYKQDQVSLNNRLDDIEKKLSSFEEFQKNNTDFGKETQHTEETEKYKGTGFSDYSKLLGAK